MPTDDSDNDGEEETLAWAGISKFLGRLESNLSGWHKEEKASEKKRLKGAQSARKELARVKARVLSAQGVTAVLGDLADGPLGEQMTALHEKAVEQRSALRKLLALLSEHAAEHKLEDEDREPLAEQLAPALEGEHLELEAKQVLQHFRNVMDAAERQAKRAETRARNRDKGAAAPAESAEDPAPPADKAGTDGKGETGGKDDSGEKEGTGERRARKGAGRAARANRRRPDDDSRDDYSYYSGDDSRDDSRSPSRRRGGKGKGRDRRPRPRYSRSPRRGPGRGGKGGRRGRDDDRRRDRDYDRREERYDRRSPRGPRGKGDRRGGRDRRDDRDDSRSRGRGSRSRGRGSRSRGRGSRTPRRNGVDMRKYDSDLERFVKVNRIDNRCETELRGLSPDSCMRVMHKPTFELSGDVRNPMAVVNARIRTVRSLKEERERR